MGEARGARVVPSVDEERSATLPPHVPATQQAHHTHRAALQIVLQPTATSRHNTTTTRTERRRPTSASLCSLSSLPSFRGRLSVARVRPRASLPRCPRSQLPTRRARMTRHRRPHRFRHRNHHPRRRTPSRWQAMAVAARLAAGSLLEPLQPQRTGRQRLRVRAASAAAASFLPNAHLFTKAAILLLLIQRPSPLPP